MKQVRTLLTLLILAGIPGRAAHAQVPDGFSESFQSKFSYASDRLMALAEAIPAEVYAWSPGEGVMSVEQVFTHIAHYNYMYPVENMGATAPAGLDMGQIESITGKTAVVEILGSSIAFTRDLATSITTEQLALPTELYGQDTQQWDVLFQLQTHLSEHLGQLIAYARMNDIVPPWAR